MAEKPQTSHHEQVIRDEYSALADAHGFTAKAKAEFLERIGPDIKLRAAFEGYADTAGYTGEQRAQYMEGLPENHIQVFNEILAQAALRQLEGRPNSSHELALAQMRSILEMGQTKLIASLARQQFEIERKQEQ